MKVSMFEKRLVSIIVAHVNDSESCIKTIRQLKKVADDDYISTEVVVVDNGSDDNHLDVIETFCKQDNHIFLQEEQKGPLHAHYRGLQESTGDYVIFPDCHIYVTEGFFSILLNYLCDNPEVGIVGSAYTSVAKEILALKPKLHEEMKAGSDFIKNPFGRGNDFSVKMGDDPTPVASTEMSGALMSREWLNRIGNMFPEAMKSTSGYVAESYLTGLITWMFGKKVMAHPAVQFIHFGYQGNTPPGVYHGLWLSALYAANIIAGSRFNQQIDEEYHIADEWFPKAFNETAAAREYVDKNKVYDIDQFLKR